MDTQALTAAQQDALLRRPFDHHARYRLAADVVMAAVGPTARVLDLGGGPGSLQAFLPRADVVSSDIVHPGDWHEQAPKLVLADGARLPFRDSSFDVVVSLDTLEHVVPESREAFLGEVARVAGRWALVVCPYDTPGVADADTALHAYVSNRFPADFPTIRILDEHLGYGHPDLAASRALLAAHGDTAVIPSGRVDRWLGWMIAFFHLMTLGVDEPVEVTQRVINRNFYSSDLVEPAYRHGVLLRTDPDDPLTPSAVAGAVVSGGQDQLDSSAADILRIVLGESLTEQLTLARARGADLGRQLDDMTARWEMTDQAERQSREYAEGLAAAHEALEARNAELEARAAALEKQNAELLALRDRVMDNPAVKLIKRLRDAGQKR